MQYPFNKTVAALAIFAGTALAVGTAQAAPIVIDDFEGPQSLKVDFDVSVATGGTFPSPPTIPTSTYTDGSSGADASGAAGIIGGFRSIGINLEPNVAPAPPGSTLGATLSIDSTPPASNASKLSWSNDNGVESRIELQWLGSGSFVSDAAGFIGGGGGFAATDVTDEKPGETFGLSLDFITDAVTDAILVRFDFYSRVGSTVGRSTHFLTKTGSGGHFALFDNASLHPLDAPNLNWVDGDSATCTTGGGVNALGIDPTCAVAGDADFTSIVGITMEAITGAPGVDLTVDLLQSTSIPEPATMTLFGAGLLGLGLARRRRKAAA